MSNITVKIAERDNDVDDVSIVKEYFISDLYINCNSTREDVFEKLNMNPDANHIITEIDWCNVVPSTHENNALYLMDVYDALMLLHELDNVLDEIGSEQINAEFEVGWDIEEIIAHSDDVSLIAVDNEYDFGYEYILMCGTFNKVPYDLINYIDFEKYGKHLVNSGEYKKTSYGFLRVHY